MTGILDEIQHFNFTGAGLISCLGQWAGCLLSALDLAVSRVVGASSCSLCGLN